MTEAEYPLDGILGVTGSSKASMNSLLHSTIEFRRGLIENFYNLLTLAKSAEHYIQRFNEGIIKALERGDFLDPEQISYINKIKTDGIPIYIIKHDPVFKGVPMGSGFADAVSFRLGENEFINDNGYDSEEPIDYHTGLQMNVYIPIKLPVMSDERQPEDDFTVPAGNDVLIKVIQPNTGDDYSETNETIFAIGEDYCYEYKPLDDAELDIDKLLQEPVGVKNDLVLDNLGLDDLIRLYKLIATMNILPSKTYKPSWLKNLTIPTNE